MCFRNNNLILFSIAEQYDHLKSAFDWRIFFHIITHPQEALVLEQLSCVQDGLNHFLKTITQLKIWSFLSVLPALYIIYIILWTDISPSKDRITHGPVRFAVYLLTIADFKTVIYYAFIAHILLLIIIVITLIYSSDPARKHGNVS